MARPTAMAGGDRGPGRPAVLHVEHRHHCGGEPADRADRQVDLAEQQHEHDAHRDRAHGHDLQHEVGEVDGREEPVVEGLEDDPDDRRCRCTHRQDAELALGQPARIRPGRARGDRRLSPASTGAGPGVARPRVRSLRLERLLRSRWAGRRPILRIVPLPPVIADATCSSVTLASAPGTSPVATRPEPQDDDAVGDGEDVDEVVADHDHAEPVLPQASDQVEHLPRSGRRPAPRSARRGAPAFGSPMSERATATDWRCPPESEPTGVRTLGIDTAEVREQPRAVLHVASRRAAADAARRTSSWPRKRLATTSRLSQSARSW